jgi:SOS-response transcriptional repressor LexA
MQVLARQERPRCTRNYHRETARLYAKTFGIDPKSIYLDHDETVDGGFSTTQSLASPNNAEGIPFAGIAESGAWRQLDDFNGTFAKHITRPPDLRFLMAKQYVWQVAGDSMDSANLPDGIFVLGVSYSDFEKHYGVLSDGKFVIVERRDGEKRERSVKQVRMFRDRIEFQPRSRNPKHETITISGGSVPGDDSPVRILAIIVEAFWLF